MIRRIQVWFRRQWASFSYIGLTLGTLFFCASLAPSLLPRDYVVQGLESGIASAVGYGLGVCVAWLWKSLELPSPSAKLARIIRGITTVCLCCVVVVALQRATVWANSIRGLMEMPPIHSVYAPYVVLIAMVAAVVVIMLARVFWASCNFVDGQLKRVLPPRISYWSSVLLISLALLTVTTKFVIKQVLMLADKAFLEIDGLVDEGIEQPSDARASGSDESIIEWDLIGRRGKEFIVSGPSEEQIGAFLGRKAMRPLRVYVGLGCGETPQERADLALEELIRVGGFDRSVLVVANPTGTGWLQPGAVDTLEFLHGGDTAIVSMQYSYLPSWLTLLVDPEGSRDSARTLFDEIYRHWRDLPRDYRPRLYLHGLSLGAYGSETCADLFTLFEDPIQGAVWSGPPFPSTDWSAITRARNADSPAWLPTFRDGRMVRFTGRENALDRTADRWGPMRFVYIQHASDPMTFFAPELLYQRPEWLIGQRGPDVSPYMTWYPAITFLQVGFDLPLATSVPEGYGHNIAAASYLDAWIEVTQPEDWSDADTLRLKQMFAETPIEL